MRARPLDQHECLRLALPGNTKKIQIRRFIAHTSAARKTKLRSRLFDWPLSCKLKTLSMQSTSNAQQKPASAAATWFATDRGIERRVHRRYPIRLDIDYKCDKDGIDRQHSGRTSNVSCGGVLFETHASVPIDSMIDLMIHWPCSLDDSCFLKVMVRGRVVRSDSRGVAVRINSRISGSSDFPYPR